MLRRPARFDAASHERHHWWRALLLRVAVCAAVSSLAWWLTGWVGLLVSVWLWAHALAADLRDLFGTAFRALRGLAFRPVQGRFYAFKGHRIRVEDDEVERQRWLALDDLATALGAPLPAASLRRRSPDGVLEQGGVVYALDAVVLAWLGEQRGDRAGQLRLWVEREVWYPARGRKASYQAHRAHQAKGAPRGAPAED